MKPDFSTYWTPETIAKEHALWLQQDYKKQIAECVMRHAPLIPVIKDVCGATGVQCIRLRESGSTADHYVIDASEECIWYGAKRCTDTCVMIRPHDSVRTFFHGDWDDTEHRGTGFIASDIRTYHFDDDPPSVSLWIAAQKHFSPLSVKSITNHIGSNSAFFGLTIQWSNNDRTEDEWLFEWYHTAIGKTDWEKWTKEWGWDEPLERFMIGEREEFLFYKVNPCQP